MTSFKRRKAGRKRLRVPVQYGVNDFDCNGYITDLSPIGIYIKTNRVFSPGTKIMISTKIDGEILLARGEVKWARQVPPLLINHTRCGMGIILTSINKRFLTFLKTRFDEAELDPGSDQVI